MCVSHHHCFLPLQDGSVHRFLHIAQDNFYRNLTSEEQADIGAFNFDHPAVSSPVVFTGFLASFPPVSTMTQVGA